MNVHGYLSAPLIQYMVWYNNYNKLERAEISGGV